MQRSQMQSEEVASRGQALYEAGIRAKVETAENIGKMVIIDVETGEYAIDDHGLEASDRLHAKHSHAALYGIRIGYNGGGIAEWSDGSDV